MRIKNELVGFDDLFNAMLPALYESLNNSSKSDLLLKEQQIFSIIQNITILKKLKKYFN